MAILVMLCLPVHEYGTSPYSFRSLTFQLYQFQVENPCLYTGLEGKKEYRSYVMFLIFFKKAADDTTEFYLGVNSEIWIQQ